MERWDRIDAVQRMQDYIEKNICKPITLHDLAICAGYSPFHCSRVFKELTGKSPFDYIRSVRLTHAALRLRDEKVKILDVALDFVFDSHEGFTRAFSKEFGLTPNKYHRNPQPIYLFMPTPIRDLLYFLREEKYLQSNDIFILMYSFISKHLFDTTLRIHYKLLNLVDRR